MHKKTEGLTVGQLGEINAELHAEVARLKEELSRYSMSSGWADQRQNESKFVRVALGFAADADDVSPKNLVDAITRLNEQVRALAAEGLSLRDGIDRIARAYTQGDPASFEIERARCGLKAPATDAILREVGARAVDLHAIDQREQIGKPHKNDAASAFAAREAVRFASRIRAGEVPNV